ncbi:hypothetical protein Droror1_Dr00023682 [Drosera rotundifolia]
MGLGVEGSERWWFCLAWFAVKFGTSLAFVLRLGRWLEVQRYTRSSWCGLRNRCWLRRRRVVWFDWRPVHTLPGNRLVRENNDDDSPLVSATGQLESCFRFVCFGVRS